MSANVALVNVGDILKIRWNESSEEFIVEVIDISEKTKKADKIFKYTVQFQDNVEGESVRTIKLANLHWELIKSSKKRSLIEEVEPITKKSKLCKVSKQSIDYSLILAPMVGGSELPFRLLCRKYGATLAYTPMIHSDKFVEDEEYRKENFQTNEQDRPLVAHFAANDPNIILKAALIVQNSCDAIDINLGCPQRIAFAGHFGSYLLDEVDRPIIISMIEKLSSHLSIPVFVKIRLLDTVPDTIRLCEQLIQAGASLITIHGRYRVNLVGRTGAGARDGPAHLDQIQTIKAALSHYNIPIITNGK